MGKAVLASQFITGLRGDIKAKLAGCDGDLEQLLVKARFEEAKIRDSAARVLERHPGDKLPLPIVILL